MPDVIGSLLGGVGMGGNAIGAAIVRLRLDSDDYQRQLAATKGETAAATGSMQSETSKFGSFAKAAFLGVGAAAVAGIAIAIKAGSDLNEQLNKSREVFGAASKSVIEFSEDAASSLGIAQSEALEAAGSLGSMFDAAGLTSRAAADMSVQMVKLGADLGSFNNIPVAEALEKIRAGLSGEAEPLRILGVFLSEARVATEAYTSGIAKQGEELTDAQKIQARFNLILKDTEKAQDDFARTVGESLPNQLKVMKAELTDVAANLGTALLPVVLEVVKAFKAIVPLAKFAADNLDLVLAVLLGFAAVQFVPKLLNGIEVALIAVTRAMGGSLTAQGAITGAFAGISAAAPTVVGALVGIGFAIKKIGDNADATAAQVQSLTDRLSDGKIGVDAYKDAVVRAEVGTGMFAARLPKVAMEAKEVANAGVQAAQTMTRVAMSESEASAAAERLTHTHEVAGKTIKNFANMTEDELKKWSQEYKSKVNDSIMVLEDLSTQSGVTSHDVVTAHREMLKEAKEMARAMREISHEHWINDDYVVFLSEQAPEWLTAFADLSERQQHRMQDQWLRSRDKVKEFNDRLDETTGGLDRLDKKQTKHKFIIKYEYEGFDPSKPGMQGAGVGHGGPG